MTQKISLSQYASDLYNIIATAIKNGVSCSQIADGLCSTGLKREMALEAIITVGAILNMKAGAKNFEEGLKYFCGK